MKEVEDQFYKYPKMLMSASAFVSRKDGSTVKLTHADKAVYAVMKARNAYFKEHYDKQSDIADMCDLTLKKAGDSIRMFIEHGIFEATKNYHGGTHKNLKYTKIHCLELVRLGPQRSGVAEREEKYLGKLDESIWTGNRNSKTKPKAIEQTSESVPEYPENYFASEQLDPF